MIIDLFNSTSLTSIAICSILCQALKLGEGFPEDAITRLQETVST